MHCSSEIKSELYTGLIAGVERIAIMIFLGFPGVGHLRYAYLPRGRYEASELAKFTIRIFLG